MRHSTHATTGACCHGDDCCSCSVKQQGARENLDTPVMEFCVSRPSTDDHETRKALTIAFSDFADELRDMCATKKARAEISMIASDESNFWLSPPSSAPSDLVCFTARTADTTRIHGLLCASICHRGLSERHAVPTRHPKVNFAPSRKRRRRGTDATVALSCDVVVWHLWVRPPARGNGLAKALLEALYGHVEAEGGLVRLSAEVLVDNKAGLIFWHKALGEHRDEEAADGFVVLSATPWRHQAP